VLFDDTPYAELGEQNFLANMYRDRVRDAFGDLDEDLKNKLQKYIENVFTCGLNATLTTMKASNAEVVIDGVDIAKDTSLYVSR